MKMVFHIITLVMFVFGTTVLPSAAWSIGCQGLDCAGLASSVTNEIAAASYNQDKNSERPIPLESQHDCGDCCHHAHAINAVLAVTLVDFSCAEQLYGISDNLKLSIIYGLDRPPRTFA